MVERIVDTINGLGYPKIVIKSDQEFSLREVQIEARKEVWNEMLNYQNKIKSSKEGLSSSRSNENVVSFGGEVMIENSPVGESQANGMVEKAIQDVQGYIRAAKFQLEKNWREGYRQ